MNDEVKEWSFHAGFFACDPTWVNLRFVLVFLLIFSLRVICLTSFLLVSSSASQYKKGGFLLAWQAYVWGKRKWKICDSSLFDLRFWTYYKILVSVPTWEGNFAGNLALDVSRAHLRGVQVLQNQLRFAWIAVDRNHQLFYDWHYCARDIVR